jgi:hypothetical protein
MLTYQTAKLLINNNHVISESVFESALEWLMDLNHWGRVAFTLPKTISECESNLQVTYDDNESRNVL